ncbi:hypothetical protein ACU61A_25240 [Pseudonocardia sichuanensis]|uniref:Uncharacterized protein n=1 Tax=Pseudonocardia kunmingensis TaxID=630975 RepID=A0A543D9U9_9PSEU|nr:hypothetical protein [Pseudonocardia kunmingensis]TQM06123.1 hypothetical protein FB558_6367 [Pseudonocardia kunmingensis]
MTVHDVYLLSLHAPYRSPQHPVPINATIVHAATLLHPAVPQPDGGLIYRCLTEFPGRTPGCVVPLSTVTFELDGGELWYRVGDWERVVEAVVEVTRTHRCDAMPLGLPELAARLLAGGPSTVHELHYTDGSGSSAGPAQRQQQLDELIGHVRTVAEQAPFWPGDNLVPPPREPRTMPYQPHAPSP